MTTSLSMMSSSFTHVVTSARISFILRLISIPSYASSTFCLLIHTAFVFINSYCFCLLNGSKRLYIQSVDKGQAALTSSGGLLECNLPGHISNLLNNKKKSSFKQGPQVIHMCTEIWEALLHWIFSTYFFSPRILTIDYWLVPTINDSTKSPEKDIQINMKMITGSRSRGYFSSPCFATLLTGIN